MKTFDDYLKAVKLKCEDEKSGKYGSYFLAPSPAQLRNLCLVLFDNELTKIDDAIFRLFFKVKDEEDLRKAIDHFDVVKFRSVRNFFTGKNEKTNMNTLNLIAALVNYSPRPYNKFLKENKEAFKEEVKEVLSEEIETQEIQVEEKPSSPLKKYPVGVNPRKKHKTLILFLIVLSLVTGGYMAKDVCFPEKQCMQWQEDHYVKLDCDAEGSGSIAPIIALDDEVAQLKRVQLKSDMVLFKYGKPLFYYCKISRDSVEFFNAPGTHPVTGKRLNAITWHMINKYVK